LGRLVRFAPSKEVFGLLKAPTDLGELTFELVGAFNLIAAQLRTDGVEDGVGDATFERRDLIGQVVQ